VHAAPTHRLEFAPPPTPGLVRSLVLAVLAHAFLVVALTWGVNWKRDVVTVTAEAELWSAVPQEAAPPLREVPPEPPAPLHKPTPPPEPPQVEPKQPDIDIALEKLHLKKEKLKALEQEKELEKQRLVKLKQEKLKQEKLAQEKLAQDKLLLEKKRLEDKRLQDKKTADQDSQRKATLQAQQDAKKLEAQRDANLKRMAGLAGGTGAPDSKGTTLQSSGPSAGYAGRIRARIKPNIVYTEEITGNPMAEVEVRTAPDGTIINRKLLKTSGDKSWDEAVLKAIDKTEVLPRDVDGRVPPALIISFRPKD
jgi:colicin import membrane protein